MSMTLLLRSARLPRYLLIFLAGLSPVLVTVIVLAGHFHGDLIRFIPLQWNDQFYYWHQILTFKEVGFQGGYYVVNEMPAQVGAFHFGASGFVYPALYGLVARVVGWQYHTGIFLNMAGISLAAWVCLVWSRFDWRQILFTGLILLFISPVLLFMPTLMEESFHQVAGLILGAIFLALLQGRQPRNRLFPWFILVLLIIVSLVRFSWVYLLLPLGLFMAKPRTLRTKAAVVIVTGVVMVAVLVIFQATSAPGNNSVFRRLARVSASPLEGINTLLGLAWENFRRLFEMENLFAPPLEVFQSLQYVGLMVTLAVGWILVHRPSANKLPVIPAAHRAEFTFHLYNLGVMVITAVVFYLPEGYYRVFAPHLLLSLVVMIGYRRFRLVGAVIAIGVLGIGAFSLRYQQVIVPNFTSGDQIPAEAFRVAFDTNLVYNPDAASPWCNTLLMSVSSLASPYPILFIPGGIGVSFYFDANAMQYPLRSRYWLLSDGAYANLLEPGHVTRLAETPAGTLYLNLDAPCEPEPVDQ